MSRRRSRITKPTVRNGGIRIVARGVRRSDPDFSRILQATLDHYTKTGTANSTTAQRSSTNDQPEVRDERA